jgi:hypothetical protein
MSAASMSTAPNPSTALAGFVSTLTESARLALNWRLLLLWLLALAVPTLLMLLPFWMAVAERLNHSLTALQLVDGFELSVFVETLMALGQNNFSPAGGGIAGLVIVLLLSPWLTGMVIASARSVLPLSLGGLIKGGLNEYGRMARMMVWGVVPLGLAAAVAGGLMKAAGHHAEQAIFESDAELWGRCALAASAVLLLLAQATVDNARALLVLEPRRRSVVLAWWRATRRLVRQPGRLFAFVLLTVAGLAVFAMLGLLRLQVAPVGGFSVLLALLLGQALVLTLAWMRCARLYALIQAGRR